MQLDVIQYQVKNPKIKERNTCLEKANRFIYSGVGWLRKKRRVELSLSGNFNACFIRKKQYAKANSNDSVEQ